MCIILYNLASKFQEVYMSEKEHNNDKAVCVFWGCIFWVYMKGKLHESMEWRFSGSADEKVTVHSTWDIYTPLLTCNTALHSVLLIGCVRKYRTRGIPCVDQCFSSPKLCDYLWACNSMAVGTVMPSDKRLLHHHSNVKMRTVSQTSSNWI